MSASGYGGESVGKKIARFDFWHRCAMWHGDAFRSLRHMILASSEGGDVSCLKAFGVKPGHIIAIDRDGDALERMLEKHPGVTAIHAEVGDVLLEKHRGVGTIFLDYCGWATDAQVDEVALAHSVVIESGVVGHGFMRGREQGSSRGDIAKEKVASIDRHREAGISGGSDGRHGWVLDRLMSRTLHHRVAPLLLWMTYYHSSCSWRRGVPMMISARCSRRSDMWMSDDAFAKKRNALGRDWCAVMENCERLAGTKHEEIQASSITAKIDTGRFGKNAGRPRTMMFPCAKRFDRDHVSVKALVDAADVADLVVPGKAPELLNIRPQRLAAFRAHVTRGTYEAA